MKIDIHENQSETDLFIQFGGCVDVMFDVRKQSATSISATSDQIDNFFSPYFESFSTTVPDSFFENKIGTIVDSFTKNGVIIDNAGTAETLTGYFSENHSTVARPVKSGTFVFDGQDEIDLTIQTTGSIDSMFSGSSIENFFSSTLVSGTMFSIVKTKTNADQQTANKFGLTNFAILNSGTADSLIPKSGVGYWVIESTFVVQ